jgi:hypothetical protein
LASPLGAVEAVRRDARRTRLLVERPVETTPATWRRLSAPASGLTLAAPCVRRLMRLRERLYGLWSGLVHGGIG